MSKRWFPYTVPILEKVFFSLGWGVITRNVLFYSCVSLVLVRNSTSCQSIIQLYCIIHMGEEIAFVLLLCNILFQISEISLNYPTQETVITCLMLEQTSVAVQVLFSLRDRLFIKKNYSTKNKNSILMLILISLCHLKPNCCSFFDGTQMQNNN